MDEHFSDKNFAHFDPLLSEKEKQTNFAEFNFADRAKIREIKLLENFFRKNFFSKVSNDYIQNFHNNL